jgi:ribose 5-phosphate isomerase A
MLLTAAALRALEYIENGMVVGLGSGRAAEAFLAALASRVGDGLQIQGVATSRRTEDLARRSGLRLTSLQAVDYVDITVDGADEVDPELNLIKGYGGALLREKIVAVNSRRVVIVIDASKLVPQLGTRGRLPIEVLPFGWRQVQRRVAELNCRATLRESAGGCFVTDNGNYILDAAVGPISDPRTLDEKLCAIPGVVTTGLFLNVADVVFVQAETEVQTLVAAAGGSIPP